MGGMIGQMLAIRHPEILLSLTLCATSSRMPEEAWPAWRERIDTARAHGMEALVDATIERWFTPDYIASNEDIIGPVRDLVRSTPVRGYTACIEAIMKLDVTDRLKSVDTPTLIVAGEDDESTPVAAHEAIHAAIPGSELAVVPAARHFVNVERSEAVNDALSRFLARRARAAE